MRVTHNIKALVDARGWDVPELARRAGLDPATAESLYAGRSTTIDLAAHSRVSEALDVRPDEILASVEEPHSGAPARTIDRPAYQHPDEEAELRDQTGNPRP